jgi:hypothetical protein
MKNFDWCLLALWIVIALIILIEFVSFLLKM